MSLPLLIFIRSGRPFSDIIVDSDGAAGQVSNGLFGRAVRTVLLVTAG
jgi:hypothetical protein